MNVEQLKEIAKVEGKLLAEEVIVLSKKHGVNIIEKGLFEYIKAEFLASENKFDDILWPVLQQAIQKYVEALKV